MPAILPAVDKPYPKGLMWFRRDLRLDDNAALYEALRSCRQLLCVFVFDRALLDALPRVDRRVEFIRESLVELDAQLRQLGAGLIVRHARAATEIPRLAQQLDVQAVFANRDDEPAALARDAQVLGGLANAGVVFHQPAQVLGGLANAGVVFHTAKDHAIFERDELLTRAGAPYAVFTPYKRAWLEKVDAFYLRPYPVRRHAAALAAPPPALARPVPTLAEIGFAPSNLASVGIATGSRGGAAMLDDFFERIDRYQAARDYPAVRGPSYLGVHLRFGTVSIRALAGMAHRLSLQAGHAGAATWLSELIWRDFYLQLLSHHPRLAEGRSFQPEYDKIQWHHGKQADQWFEAWCQGRTGYPLVDAAMAQINQTGYMHNRLRMVVASFLCKDLGLDWRRGEAYFATQLNDFELASNNGGWQWASGSGCDAQPYFRIFNPVTQSRRFDPEGKFIRRYLPQLAALDDQLLHAPWTASPEALAAAGVRLGDNYAKPLVDHAKARERTLQRYAVARGTPLH